MAQKASGIGVWENVLQLMAVLAAMTNVGLMGFTSDVLRRWLPQGLSPADMVGAVMVLEHAMLFLGYVMVNSVPSTPSSVSRALARDRAREFAARPHLGPWHAAGPEAADDSGSSEDGN